ncbi:MAG: hypothetical protein J6M53_03920, partial [Bacteroidaceae bacterium]|nr:hypothetical protein [Bacteroidaceae bacterium]
MYGPIREEELKNRVARDWFAACDTAQIIGNIDFCAALPTDDPGLAETVSLLWAEAKRGTQADPVDSLAQLVLTIGRARTADRHLPPAYLGAFDAEKIAFLPYNAVLDVLGQNDFNWNVAPSDHTTREFRQLRALIADSAASGLLLYYYEKDERELRRFILRSLVQGKVGAAARIRINKNNFT